MNRKAQGPFGMSLIETIKLTLLVLVIFLVFIPLGKIAYDYFVPSVDQDLVRTIETIVTEIEELKDDLAAKDPGSTVQISPAISLQSKTKLTAYSKTDPKLPNECKRKACVCIFQTIDNKKLTACETLKNVEFTDSGKIIIESIKSQIKNIKITATDMEDAYEVKIIV